MENYCLYLIFQFFLKITYNYILKLITYNLYHNLGVECWPKKDIDWAINNNTDAIYKTLDNNKKYATVFIDLAKAFDTVYYEILLSKINNIGISKLALKLIKSYLSLPL